MLADSQAAAEQAWRTASELVDLVDVFHDVNERTQALGLASEAMAEELSRLQFAETGGLAIDQLRGPSALETVDFASKSIGELSAHVIARLVRSNTTLKDLNMKGKILKFHEKMTDLGVQWG